MPQKMRPELTSPRTVSAPAGAAPVGFRPWVEVAALARVSVPGWGISEETWVHWAVPVVEGRPDTARAVAFDPGRRAASPGEPPRRQRLVDAALDDATAGRLCDGILSAWRPSMHYNAVLRLASRLDEPIDAFRRWCASLVSRAVLQGEVPPSERVAAARVAGAVATRVLTPAEIEVVRLRAGVAWYPDGIEPATGLADRL
jgi:hypothetical protein